MDAGTLNLSQLRGLTVTLDEGFDVLTGIGRASRWHELSRFHLGAVLDQAVTGYRWIVLDIASDLSVDESLLYDTVAPVRAAAGIEAAARAGMRSVGVGPSPALAAATLRIAGFEGFTFDRLAAAVD